MINNPFRRPVKSLIPAENVIDTLPTKTPGLKVLLLEDNTWRYWKEPESVSDSSVFTDKWSTSELYIYRTQLADLPDSTLLYLVDSTYSWVCPSKNKIFSPFGKRRRRMHKGVDISLPIGQPIYAAFPGRVRISKYCSAYGNLIVLRHENGLETYYGHLSKYKVKSGQWVDAGEVIGYSGASGRVTGPHLHFETRYQGHPFDPQLIIDFEKGELKRPVFMLRKDILK